MRKICENCEHFNLYYKKPKTIEYYSLAGYGYCIYPFRKLRKNEASACRKFKEVTGDRDGRPYKTNYFL